jgi:hypothetical protein
MDDVSLSYSSENRSSGGSTSSSSSSGIPGTGSVLRVTSTAAYIPPRYSQSNSGDNINRENNDEIKGAAKYNQYQSVNHHANSVSRQELVESPHTTYVYKEFYKVFRNKERESLESARDFAREAISWIPDSAKWRAYLELAEISKRNNEFDEVIHMHH